MSIQKLVADLVKSKESEGGVDSIYYVGCGGSYAMHYATCYLVQHRSKSLKTGLFTSNEFVLNPPEACGKNSVVVVCSLSGTPETTEAAKTAKRAGAAVVAFYGEESEMSKSADFQIRYTKLSEPGVKLEQTNLYKNLEFTVELLSQLEGFAPANKFRAGLRAVDAVYAKAKESCVEGARRFGEACKDDDVIYVMGAGPNYGAAYIFSICNLMEMQWIHSPTVDYGELLHGPFETVDKQLPIFCLVGDGPTRPMDERALKFLKTYGEKLFILDAKELDMAEIDPDVREYFCPMVFSALLQNLYLHALADQRQHPIETRRYMWKVDY